MKKAEKILNKTADVLDIFFYVFGIAGMILAILSYGANIISWWIFSRRFATADDYALIGLVWASYAGLGILFRSGGHCTIDFMVNLLPEKGKSIMRIIQGIVISLVSFIAIYYSWKLTAKSINKTLTISKIPYFYVDIAIPLGYAHLILLTVVDTVRNILRLFRQKEKESA